jgi:N-succinyl-L-ornithine transcarbamylase
MDCDGRRSDKTKIVEIENFRLKFNNTEKKMRHFTNVKDIPDLKKAMAMAFELKKDPLKYIELGRNKTMILIFFDSSLRTRLSTQKAALNLGMNVIVLDINKDGWKLETQMGVVMDGDKAEHIREAVPVIGRYCDIIGVRSFARYKSKDEDYGEAILNQFIEYAGVPVVSMESATRHPMQTFADLITIEQYKTKARPKVVLSWAPHPRALPQAVPNSFAEWMLVADVDFVITQPEGYELAEEFTKGAKIEYDQKKAFEGADFIYAKNWASYREYGKILSMDKAWTVDEAKMKLTNNAKFMHCLPVRRNMIVSDAVIDSPDSVVIEEAANRVVSAQTVIKMILDSQSK